MPAKSPHQFYYISHAIEYARELDSKGRVFTFHNGDVTENDGVLCHVYWVQDLGDVSET